MNILEKINKTKKLFLLKNFDPKFAIIAGSGLGSIKNDFKIVKSIKYSKIPFFSKTTILGHSGEVNFCSYKNTDFILFNGRIHYYEGFKPEDIIYSIRVINSLGIKNLIITAAVGAINTKYLQGDIVLLKDHINFTGNNPLIGKHIKDFGNRFADMSEVYNKNLIKISKKEAAKNKIKIHEGVYFGVSGPSYETAAEVKAFRKLGADVVGMSVVYEAIAASQMRMKVLGLTYVSNMACGINAKRLSHNEVLETGKTAAAKIIKIIKGVMENTK